MKTYGGEYTGRKRIGNLADAHRLSDKLTQERYISDQPWWTLVIGSMSPKSRAVVIDHLTLPSNVSVRKLTRQDRKLMARKHPAPPISWKERLQLIVIFPLWIWSWLLALISFAARLIGRGPRMYLLHVERVPPPDDPPGGASVREPRRPIPPDGSLRLR